ncbi:MAG: sigma-70 family RNA polymerase sigma factor, partial [Clostridia bacterium]|nr:sigma-70 family RNA polymerase sigma factor [Clostridia bacterium]
AVQNVFVRWLKNGTQFETAEHEKAYFLRAASNECINVRSSFWRTKRVDFEDIPEPSSDDSMPEEPGAILRSIPAKYREVLYLFYYEELSSEEIAETLSRNHSTVRTQLQRGRELLKKALEKSNEED